MTKRKYRTDEEWLSLIHECRLSGLTDKQWCETHQICPSNFYYQIQKFSKRACEIPESQSKTTLTAQKQGIQCLSPAKKIRSFCGKAKRFTIIFILAVSLLVLIQGANISCVRPESLLRCFKRAH